MPTSSRPSTSAPPVLTLDFTEALASALGKGKGFDDLALERLSARLPEVAAAARREHEGGGLAFLDLPGDEAALAGVEAWAARLPKVRDVVVVGIGGSALGARLLDQLRPFPRREPELTVVDTVDPSSVEALTAHLDPARTLLVGVSKSGETMETAAVFCVLERWLTQALRGEAGERIVVVCGEGPNAFRAHAEARGYPTFSLPARVGGRYSALSVVGLVPAAACGVDVRAVLEGAARAAAGAFVGALAGNPALALAAFHHLAHEAGRNVPVLFSYGERFAPLGPWWVQLVAESLGKTKPHGPLGPTPVAAVGPADQHSLLQLLLEGPDDKWVVFLDAEDAVGRGPVVPPAADALAPVGGVPLGTLLAAEREATAFALARSGRPALGLSVPSATPGAIGALVVTWETAVAYMGRLLGIDPFDQPAVQLGKLATRARLKGEPAALANEMDARRGRPRRTSARRP
jgi:glucose-6-phosphate isomerase